MAALGKEPFSVAKVERKKKKRYPSPPFVTSTLQQEAARKLRFSARQTMSVAQRLYEGIEVGDEGAVGLITYMRSDSTRLSNDAIAAARDWYTAVGLDRATGMAWAGAYVGDGVSTTNLAGRTLRDLILGERTELTGLPWVGHRSKPWEPEPLRWLGVNAALLAMSSADGAEARSGRPSKRATYVKKLIGA